MKFSPKAAAAALIAVVALAAVPSDALAQQKIGSANVQKIFTEIKETKDLQARFQSRGSELERSLQAAQQRAAGLQEQRKNFKPGSAEYDRTNQELIRAAVELEAAKQIGQQEMAGEQKRLTKALHDKIVAAVGEVAKEKQLTVVLSQIVPVEPSEEAFERMTPDQLGAQLRQTNLLYIAPDIDITAAVITRLDASYVSPAPSAAQTTPPPPAATPSTPTTPTTPAPNPGGGTGSTPARPR